MAEYSRIAKGNFTAASGQTSAVVNLPFQPDFVEIWNYTNIAGGAGSNTVINRAWWDNKLLDASTGDNATMVEGYNSGTLIYDVIQTNGISAFSAGQLLQYGPTVLLGGSGGIAKTSATVLTVTTTAVHGLVPGNWVTFQNLYQTSTTGMQQIAGIPFQVLTSASTTTFTIGWVGNAANLTAITAGGLNTLASFKQILYPALYEPGVAFPWSIAQSGGVVTVKTTAPHNFQVGQEIAFRIPSVYGGQQLNELPNNTIPASPQYFYVVTASANSFTFNYSGPLTTFSVANPAFTSFPGLKFAQVIATGDVNSGGYPYTGGALYPSPTVFGGNSLTAASTINGPAIQGAYINNTSQGFIIGPGAATVITGTTIVTSASQIYWRAFLSDYASP